MKTFSKGESEVMEVRDKSVKGFRFMCLFTLETIVPTTEYVKLGKGTIKIEVEQEGLGERSHAIIPSKNLKIVAIDEAVSTNSEKCVLPVGESGYEYIHLGNDVHAVIFDVMLQQTYNLKGSDVMRLGLTLGSDFFATNVTNTSVEVYPIEAVGVQRAFSTLDIYPLGGKSQMSEGLGNNIISIKVVNKNLVDYSDFDFDIEIDSDKIDYKLTSKEMIQNAYEAQNSTVSAQSKAALFPVYFGHALNNVNINLNRNSVSDTDYFVLVRRVHVTHNSFAHGDAMDKKHRARNMSTFFNK